LAHALFSINAVKGFEYGAGFDSASMRGSEMNDEFVVDNKSVSKTISTKTNFSGGIQGGISNGEDIYFKVAFKPVPSINISQNTIDKNGNECVLNIKGRHDICFVPRAVPIVEAMTAIVLLDQFLLNRTVKM
jgi:chorismate synthase